MTAPSSHCWVQISAGQGPDECALAVQLIAHRIVQEASQYALKAEFVDSVAGSRPGTFISALIGLRGSTFDAFIEEWRGTVQWICASPYRPGYKRKNWFVGVEVLAATSTDQSEVNMKDIVFETMRASGPGGQHVNTTDSAVRAIHRPTGTTVVAREERSQHMNKKLAVARIENILEQTQQAALTSERQILWKHHNQLERGNPVRVFEGEKLKERGTK
ncbi:MAG: peptide chain release factor H [Alphaproteobacteria bacterium]|nr:peptide chain release factor H [Alphaproteobacteria bacterium]